MSPCKIHVDCGGYNSFVNTLELLGVDEVPLGPYQGDKKATMRLTRIKET